MDSQPNNPNLVAIVLAAGLSSRMGSFKPLLPFGHETVIEHTIKYLRGAGVQTVMVVIGHRGDEIRWVLQNQEILYAINSRPEGPMAESVILGVAKAPRSADAFVITPVDHTAVAAPTVNTLIEHWRAGSRLVIPTWKERGGHPVIIDSSFREELISLNEGGMRSFFAAHKSEIDRVSVTSPYVVRDLDTWDDYLELHHDFFGFPPKDAGRYS